MSINEMTDDQATLIERPGQFPARHEQTDDQVFILDTGFDGHLF